MRRTQLRKRETIATWRHLSIDLYKSSEARLDNNNSTEQLASEPEVAHAVQARRTLSSKLQQIRAKIEMLLRPNKNALRLGIKPPGEELSCVKAICKDDLWRGKSHGRFKQPAGIVEREEEHCESTVCC